MSIAGNKSIAERFVAYLEALDYTGLLSILAPDTIWWDVMRGELDTETYLDAASKFSQLYASPFQLMVHGMIAEEDRVAIEMESRVTLNNGRVYNNKYHILIKLKNEKIVSVREYMNTKHIVDTLNSLK